MLSPELGDRRHALGGQHGARGIRRRVDHDGPRPSGEPLADRLGPVLEAVFLGHPDVDRSSVGVSDEVRVARVIRVAQHDLVAGIEQVAEEEQHRRRGAGRDQDLIR